MPVTLPNLLTLMRLVLSPALIPLAASGHRALFWALLLLMLATDATDGWLARATGQASEFGARLDSLADCALYCTAPIAALLLYPLLWSQHRFGVVAVAVGYLVPITIGWIKFHRLTSYHTLAARAVCFLLPSGFLLYAAVGTGWLLDVAAVVLLLSAAEEVWLTFVLRRWTPNVPSIWHLSRTSSYSPRRQSGGGSLA